jgi:acetylornithine deacetylase/succinyl-diaminopimelate desuccinylase family protein
MNVGLLPETAADAVDAVLAAHQGELTDLVGDMVSIDSQIPPHADERAIIAFLNDRLASKALGRSNVISCHAKRPNLITRIAGSGGGRTLLLSGHVDTKPVGDARNLWVTDPLVPSVREERIYGLGTSDMKAAIAAMVYAVEALKEAGVHLRGDVVLAFTADEEAGSTYGAKFVAGHPECRADACLIGEPSGWQRDWQGIHIACRGLCCFRVRVHGTQMHSSLADRVASSNASTQMARLLLRAADEIQLEYEPHPLGAVPTINAGVIVSGGVGFGIYPGLAEFGCEIRTLPGMTESAVKESVMTWVKRLSEEDSALQVDVEFEPGLGWIPGTEIDADHPLVLAVRAASERVLGVCPPLSVFPGGTDGPWFKAAGIPSVPSFGPGILTHCHGPNEFVSIRSVEDAARIYAQTVLAFCG